MSLNIVNQSTGALTSAAGVPSGQIATMEANINKKLHTVYAENSSIVNAEGAAYYILMNYPEECASTGVCFKIVNGSDWFTGEIFSDWPQDVSGRTGWGWVMNRGSNAANGQIYQIIYVYGVGITATKLSKTVVQKSIGKVIDTTSGGFPVLVDTPTTPDGDAFANWALTVVPRQLQNYWINYNLLVYPHDTVSNQCRIFCAAAYQPNMAMWQGSQICTMDYVWTKV